MEYFTADTYKTWKRIGQPFDKNGKLYTRVKDICDKCNGTGIAISHVENGVPIPYVNDEGICYCCDGVGFREKEVRLYTEKEYKRMMAIADAARAKKEAEREAKIKAEYQDKKNEWIAKEGFSIENLVTYVVTGDSYSIKDKLKEQGFRYSQILKWHRATPSEEYPCIEVKLEEVADFSAWGTGNYYSTAQKLVQDKIDALKPESHSEWIGVEKEKISDLRAEVTAIQSYTNRYGYGRIFTFLSGENIIKWFTSSNPNIDINDIVLINATIKEHSEYRGEKQTIITRPKFQVVG